MIVTIYDQATGLVRRVLDVPPQDVSLNFDPATEAVYSDEVDPESTYFFNGEPVPLPPRPGPWAVWNGTEWSDPRTPADFANDLNQRRAVAQLDKSDLLIRLAMIGILTPEEAEDAAGGGIPASMQAMLTQLPPDAQMAARIKWKSDNLISRNHPVIVTAAYAMGIPDTQLDEIFNVA